MASNIRKIKKTGINGELIEVTEYDPYDISLGAIMSEETVAMTYKAYAGEAAPAGLGFKPREGTFLYATFPAPPPPPPPEKPDAKPEKQTVSIRLPKVKEPFRNIVIPQNEGEVIKFHPN
jgi:hypothetical protein